LPKPKLIDPEGLDFRFQRLTRKPKSRGSAICSSDPAAAGNKARSMIARSFVSTARLKGTASAARKRAWRRIHPFQLREINVVAWNVLNG
jgi:hypothetical protein